MNVASLELCKELYELSGWELEHPTMVWCKDKDGYFSGFTDGSEGYLPSRKLQEPDYICPAYDLGYLLRKLPQYVVIRKNALRPRGNSEGNWKGGYTVFLDQSGGMSGRKHYAATPEDAACKLVCELIRQGVIKAGLLKQQEKPK